MTRAALFTILCLGVVAGCGGKSAALTRAERGLAACFQAANAVQKGFTSWDKAQQERIVNEAESLEEGKEALQTHRKKRVVISGALIKAYTSIGLASTALLLYDVGRVGEATVISRLTEAAKAVEIALRAWESAR